jgi:hypothetical protein
VAWDAAAADAEIKWLLAHPHFDQKPASIREFVGPGYLDIEDKVRPGLLEAFIDIFGEEVNGERIASFERAMLTGAIGIGKTTFASIALPYMAHWVLCLKDPQDYFGLLPGSRIAFMQMSTSEKQAIEVVFGDIFARIKHSAWFVENYPYDDKYTKQIRFSQKDIWILPGDSLETSFEGYNILGGILDEMDSHKITRDKDYADVGYDAIHNRIASRFPVNDSADDDEAEVGHRGLLLCIGQMKKGNGFAARKYREFMGDKMSYVVRMTIWESFGWDRYTRADGTRKSFWYDTKRKSIVPAAMVGIVKNVNMIEIPSVYRKQFEDSPEKALRDLAGIPPTTADAFISMVDRIDEARDRWITRNGEESPVDDNPTSPQFAAWFLGTGDPRRRHMHIDLATSGDGDALGMAMGHVHSLVDRDDELKPYIVIDFLLRIKAMPGQQILLSDVRRIIFNLKEDRKFRLVSVSLDGFQSTDTMQTLRKKRYKVDYMSVDKTMLPYEDLREAIYDRRIEFPPYKTYLKKGDTELVEIGVKELSELQDTGRKVDHPANGSKDVADAMAGVCYALMGDRSYRRGVTSESSPPEGSDDDDFGTYTASPQSALTFNPGVGLGLQAPIPPNVGGLLGLAIPDRLQNRNG